jgi:hypothetical protein
MEGRHELFERKRGSVERAAFKDETAGLSARLKCAIPVALRGPGVTSSTRPPYQSLFREDDEARVRLGAGHSDCAKQ